MNKHSRNDRNAAPRSPKLHSLLASLRAGEWWEHKLVPIMAMFYATGLMLQEPLAPLWPALLTLLFALVPGAAYVSVINDFTDRADDLAAGKANRLVGRSRGAVFALIAVPIALGLFFMALWRGDPLVLGLYIAAWVSFSLYSLPPLRLKTRGLAGVFADAAGAHLFPTLLAVVLAFRAMERPIDPYWLGAVAIWALAYGLRGILWHQLNDLENDRASGARTFAQRCPPQAIASAAKLIILPMELGGVFLLLWQLDSWPTVISLALYAVMVAAKVQRWNMHATVVRTRPRFLIVMHDYYGVFFPVAVLLASSLHHPGDFVVLGAQLLLFPRSFVRMVTELWQLWYDARRDMRRFLHRARLQLQKR